MNSLISKAIFAVVLMTNLSTYAQSLNRYTKAQDLRSAKAAQSANMGGVATGGGDLCEDRIQNIRGDLRAWIVGGAAESLELPAGVSSSEYSERMLQSMASTKIHCVGQGDDSYPVTVSGVAKVCRFDRNGAQATITCDYEKFQSMDESQQYILIHHEYAGISDIETPNGAESKYEVSNQISNYLEVTTVKKLAVKFGGSKFKSVPKSQIAAYLKGIPWKRAAYKHYEQSEGWYASEALMGNLELSPEQNVKSVKSLKAKKEDNRITLLFESAAGSEAFKTQTAVVIEDGEIKLMRVDLKFLAVVLPDTKNPGKSVEGWKTIGWELYY